jgi:uncharacterized pyridoxamine 5'-phosphate oxidase family protein
MKNPDEIELKDLTKQFEYARMCGEIDSCDDINEIKLAVKCYLKLYLATLETINDLYKI